MLTEVFLERKPGCYLIGIQRQMTIVLTNRYVQVDSKTTHGLLQPLHHFSASAQARTNSPFHIATPLARRLGAYKMHIPDRRGDLAPHS